LDLFSLSSHQFLRYLFLFGGLESGNQGCIRFTGFGVFALGSKPLCSENWKEPWKNFWPVPLTEVNTLLKSSRWEKLIFFAL
jgi:hypothetical protein